VVSSLSSTCDIDLQALSLVKNVKPGDFPPELEGAVTHSLDPTCPLVCYSGTPGRASFCRDLARQEPSSP